MKLIAFALIALSLQGATEADLRKALQAKTGKAVLPPGVIEISREIALASDAHDLAIAGSETTIKASAMFRGRALLTLAGGVNIRISNLSLDGNRDETGRITPPLPASAMASRFTGNNGILAENTTGLEIAGIKASRIPGFAILVNGSRKVNLHDVDVEESGGYGPERRNDGAGGILIEEGTVDFSITRCLFGKVRGNAITVRALDRSPLNTGGRISENEFALVARDAVQLAGASGLVVENNRGRLIGYPVEETDVSGGILPSAVHTKARVEKSTIRANTFDNIDGRCFTLSGITSSEVSGNSCTEELFGAMVIESSGNRVLANHFLRLNLAHKDSPDQLSAGIYLTAEAKSNQVQGNEITGYGMSRRCVVAAAAGNQISKNDCSDEITVALLQRETLR